MPIEVLYDLSKIDPDQVEISKEEIQRVNPQRFEFALLDGILKYLPDEGIIVGFKDARPDEYWVRGHVPGQPILPGVLIIESAGQLCTYFQKTVFKESKLFFGFGGIDKVKFRRTVLPGQRVTLIAKAIHLNFRRSVFDVQGVVEDMVIFQGVLTGILIPARAAERGKL